MNKARLAVHDVEKWQSTFLVHCDSIKENVIELTFQKGISGIQSVAVSSSGIVCRESLFIGRLFSSHS